VVHFATLHLVAQVMLEMVRMIWPMLLRLILACENKCREIVMQQIQITLQLDKHEEFMRSEERWANTNWFGSTHGAQNAYHRVFK
jgi:hypothetical protein